MIIGIAAMIVGLMLIVLVHEFGHWIVARMFGMWTPVFSIGFGPRKYSLVLGKFWDTEFRLSPIPLGGYVALPEMGDETTSQMVSEQLGATPRKFRTFAVWKRTCVAVAGVVMNVLFAAALLFSVFAFKGEPQYVIAGTFVGGLTDQVTIAKDAGLQPRDQILSVDGQPVTDPSVLQKELITHKGQPVALHIQRNDKQFDVTVVPNSDGRIGIAIGVYEKLAFVHVGATQAASDASRETGQFLGKICYAIGGMLHLVPTTPGTDNGMHSIVGIVQYGADAWTAGFVQFVFVLITISLNLAVFNILPIPMLDGGYLLFFSIEKLRGKPLSVDTQNRLKMFFLYVLLMVFAFGLLNDFLHPIGK